MQKTTCAKAKPPIKALSSHLSVFFDEGYWYSLWVGAGWNHNGKGFQNGLSKTLQHLSEKVRNAADEVSKLKQLNDKINANCEDYKARINIQIDALIEHLQERRQRLQEFAEVERDSKKKALRDQVNRCTSHLNRTTALMQLCIEVLKEPDAVVYLQIGQQLNNRASTQDFTWNREMRTKAEVDPEFVLSLDTRPVQNAIQGLEFAQLKSPSAPQFDATECLAENNSVTVVWHCPANGTAIDGYTLEIDSGRDDGHFREVYTGPDNICTIDGLHFDTIYNVRVKAFNSAGESAYSDPIGLQTAHVAWFQLTKSSSQRDVVLSNERATLTGVGLDYRVVLGNVAFSRGVHYWEITVDQFDGNGDIVIGVAQPSVNRHTMLGKDLHGWAMYIDDKRSWYIHNDAHHGRIALHGGTGAVLGVLMDCDQGVLSFYVNDRRLEVDEACYAFKNMPRGLYYPAFSVNKNAKITVHTGLVPPTLRSSTSDDSVTDTL
uniref:Fibronectin type-III domain-containing protein n=1 Tax=Panagrellus redivivus TaxID=6233 RepID=A0A7E4VX68_PANRE